MFSFGDHLESFLRDRPWAHSACPWAHSACMLSAVWLLETPSTVARQPPLCMEFSRQAYRGGLPFPTPGDLPNPGIDSMSPESPAMASRFFTTAPLRNPANMAYDPGSRKHWEGQMIGLTGNWDLYMSSQCFICQGSLICSLTDTRATIF